jgi:SET domain-containing protein
VDIPVPSLRRDEIYRGFKICIRRSERHRWGVFALRDIQKDEMLEEAPYFSVPCEEIDTAPSCRVYSYWLCDGYMLIGTGCASLYNHSYEPNADYQVDKINEIIRHYAIKDIKAGEEIVINYGEENAKDFLSSES